MPFIGDRLTWFSPCFICQGKWSQLGLSANIFLFFSTVFLFSCKNSRLIQVPSYYGNKWYLNRRWIHVSQLQWVSRSSCGIWLHKCMGIMFVSRATELLWSPWEDCVQMQKGWCNDQTHSGGRVSFYLNGKCQEMAMWIFCFVNIANASNKKREWIEKPSKSSKKPGKCKAIMIGWWC